MKGRGEEKRGGRGEEKGEGKGRGEEGREG